jgi:hypothetical protein
LPRAGRIAVTDRLERERRILQRVVAIASLVPIAAGLYGVLFGAGLTGDRMSVSGDSHYRYLSGLLLGIGLLFWTAIPAVETKSGRVQLLTLVVVAGGLGRLAGLALTGLPSLSMFGALAMELVVTPLLCLWQLRIARAYREPARERAMETTP